jgi:hypothetical protein
MAIRREVGLDGFNVTDKIIKSIPIRLDGRIVTIHYCTPFRKVPAEL